MNKIGLVIASLAIFAAFAAADTATTVVWFNVPSDISFLVTLPGQAGVASGATADIEYNATVPTLDKINCSVRLAGGVDMQTDSIPCFNYSNTGNRAINVTLQFGTALPAGVTVKAGNNDTAWIASCTCTDLTGGNCPRDDCVEVSDSAAVRVAAIAYAGYQEVWMWADFSSYMGGAGASRTLTHTTETG